MSGFQKILYIIAGICFAVTFGGFFLRINDAGIMIPDYSEIEGLSFASLLKNTDKMSSGEKNMYDRILKANQDYLKIQVEKENEDKEIEKENEDTEIVKETAAQPLMDLSADRLSDFDYLINQFYIVDAETETNSQQLDAAAFLSMDFSLQNHSDSPQILIYHTHAQEGFADSDLSDPQERIVGVGSYLAKILTEQYGYNVLHISEEFDVINGVLDRSTAYEEAEYYIEEILQKYPSIEVVIDLHRDGVPDDRHLVTEIQGKPTALIMNFNGLSYLAEEGPIDYLPNEYLEENLAFSFQLMYQAALYYPTLYRGNYLSAYRYNLELRPRSILLEAGAQTNTLQEVKNAMEPFADILDKVLSKNGKKE